MRVRRGQRTDIYMIEVSSLDAYAREHGLPRVGSKRRKTAPDRLDDLAARVDRLEARLGMRDEKPDAVNMQFANLRLLAVQESYERAMRELLVADEHRTKALQALQHAAAEYRAVVQQFHLPSTPPATG